MVLTVVVRVWKAYMVPKVVVVGKLAAVMMIMVNQVLAVVLMVECIVLVVEMVSMVCLGYTV